MSASHEDNLEQREALSNAFYRSGCPETFTHNFPTGSRAGLLLSGLRSRMINAMHGHLPLSEGLEAYNYLLSYQDVLSAHPALAQRERTPLEQASALHTRTSPLENCPFVGYARAIIEMAGRTS